MPALEYPGEGDAQRVEPALCARMSETVPPPEFIVEGETGR
jgi:hypothetical protein